MNKQLMRLTVAAKSKFGVLDATTNKWYNPKDKDMLSQFIVDNSYDIETEENKGKDGRTYTNIVSAKRAVSPVVAPSLTLANRNVQTGTLPVPKFNAPANKARDFDKEARGKTVCALLEAGLQSPRVNMLENEAAIFEWLDAVVAYGIKKVFGE